MTVCFITLLNMSITAGVTALAVMLARAAFKKLPKRLTCALWALVGLRLALPFSWESALSLIPRASTVRQTVAQTVPALTDAAIPPGGGATDYFTVSNFAPSAATGPVPAAASSFDWLRLLTAVWIAGAAVMLGYVIVSAVLLRRQTGAFMETEQGVRVVDGLASPFVLGVFRPKIYLPSSLNAAQKEMILAHERAHLQRRDHLVKPFAFLLLAVYWFNPVLWIAYALLCRDIELACDEKVIQDMDKTDRAFYSQTLLDCGANHKRIAACPVAFGEIGVKERVKNVLNYKKPAFWIILIAVVAGIVLAVCFLTDPKQKEDQLTGVRVVYTDMVENPLFFDITKDGRLVQAEAPTDDVKEIINAHPRYSAPDDCFTPYTENGILKNRLAKTELRDSNGETAPVTETRRTILEAVAGLEGYIVKTLIFESHNGDDRYFVAVTFRLDMDIYSDVFSFNERKGTLEKLCRIDNQTVTAVYPTADDAQEEKLTAISQDGSLDDRIFAALQAESSGKYLEGECFTEAHYIFDTEEKDGKTVVCALVQVTWFGFVNNYFTDVSGSQCPMVLTFDGDDCIIERVKDGELYADSLKELFPAKYADAILKHGDRYDEKLWNEVAEQARAYLHRIDRSATVCPISEAGLSTLTDHGVSVEVSNQLANMPLLADYPFYGTKETIEDGVRYVYRTSYDAQTGLITYLKYIYGEDQTLGTTQRIDIDAATGEIIADFSAPVIKGENAQVDFDWEEAAKIDVITLDIDGDGVEDRCVMSDGPTSGLFTFYLTVTPAGTSVPSYQNIFLTDWSDLSFVEAKKDMDLYVSARNPLNDSEEKLYRVLIENGELTLRSEDGDMPHWAGEADVLGQTTIGTAAPKISPSVGYIGEAHFDVDGNGKPDACDLVYGPFSEPFTFMFESRPLAGESGSSYVNIFQSEYTDLRFAEEDGKLYINALKHKTDPTKTNRFEVLVKDGMIVLRGADGDMPYWGGQKGDLLNRRWTARAYPELYSLDASGGLDVYVWLFGTGNFSCWLTEHGKEPETEVLLRNSDAIEPEGVRDLLAFYEIPAEKVTVIPYQHPISSYLWAEDGKIIDGSMTEKELRAMFGL